ncbi:hypothetical protein SB757_20770, partial [Pseudomonas sp. SIMBA_065]
SRCAARAALDLIGAENAKPGTWWPRIQSPGIHNLPPKKSPAIGRAGTPKGANKVSGLGIR